MSKGIVRIEPTHRQAEVLAFVKEYISGQGYPPTLREIGDHLQLRSLNSVSDLLKALIRKGYLARDGIKSRALKIL